MVDSHSWSSEKNSLADATVSVIVVTHNRKSFVGPLLDSIYSSSFVPHDVTVVDNASSDGTGDFVATSFPRVALIQNSENVLVSQAFNVGIRRARSKFVLVVADDNVLDERCIEELLRVFLGRSDAGMVGPVMYYYDAPSRVWFRGSTVSLWTGLSSFSMLKPPRGVDSQITGPIPNCFMFRRKLVDQIGPLDQNAFPFHNEEADFYFRVRSIGLHAYIAFGAKEWHRTPLPRSHFAFGSGDFNVDNPTRAYLNARSRPLLVRRHASTAQLMCFFLVFFPITTVAYALLCLLTGSPGNRAKTAIAFVRGSAAGAIMPLPKSPSALTRPDK